MCQSQSVGSYEQAGEVSRMELQGTIEEETTSARWPMLTFDTSNLDV